MNGGGSLSIPQNVYCLLLSPHSVCFSGTLLFSLISGPLDSEVDFRLIIFCQGVVSRSASLGLELHAKTFWRSNAKPLLCVSLTKFDFPGLLLIRLHASVPKAYLYNSEICHRVCSPSMKLALKSMSPTESS